MKINEKSTKKSEFKKAQCEKHKLKDVDTFKLATVLDKTEKYMVHIKRLKLVVYWLMPNACSIPPIFPQKTSPKITPKYFFIFTDFSKKALH